MKLNDLRRRIAKAIAPEQLPAPPQPQPLAPLDEAPIPPMPGSAVPLTADQRENLEKLRDRYAPDRQKPTSSLDRLRDADIKRYQAGER